MNAGEGRTMEVRQIVQASRETSFEAWTRPEHVKNWWAPTETAECTRCEIDLQVGGRYRLEMRDTGTGAHCQVTGQFLEIERPSRIVYTWDAKTDQGEVTNTLVEVTFHRMSETLTEVIIRHKGLPETPAGQGHRQGWELMLASLAGHLKHLGS